MFRLAEANAKCLTLATSAIITRFATQCIGKPCERYIHSLRTVIRKRTHVLSVDAASDELLGVEIGRKPLTGSLKVFMPFCRVMMRDPAHCSRMPFKRPWTKCERLKNVLRKYIQLKNSPAQLIQNSETFRTWYRHTLATDLKRRKTWFSLRSAKHRFESFATPLLRMTVGWFSLLKTLVKISTVRSDAAGKAARNFLINVREADIVLIGMMTDAAQAGLKFTRQLDVETLDVARVHEYVTEFLASVNDLFGTQRCCLTRRTSYTALMCSHLCRPVLWTIASKTYSVGAISGPSTASLDDAFQEMRNWLYICSRSLDAEFPRFSVAHAFRIFNLHEHHSADDVTDGIARVALFASVDANDFRAAYHALMPLAEARMSTTSCSNKDAWVYAYRCSPMDGMTIVLHRYLAFGLATSGVEQSFSKGCFSFGPQQLASSTCHPESVLKIGIDSQRDDISSLVAQAQIVWKKIHASPRNGTKRALRLSAKPSGSSSKSLRMRRSTITLKQLQTGIDALPLNLTEDHLREKLFIEGKHQRRLVQACDERLLLAPESTDELRKQAAAKNQKLKDGQAKRDAKEAANQLFLAQEAPSKKIFRGMRAFVPSRCEAFAPLLLQNNWFFVRARNVQDAAVVLSDKPGHLSLTSKQSWTVIMLGLWVISPLLLRDGAGSCIKYVPAVGTKRTVYISEAFTRKHPRLHAVIRSAMAMPFSKTTAITLDKFLEKKEGHIQTTR